MGHAPLVGSTNASEVMIGKRKRNDTFKTVGLSVRSCRGCGCDHLMYSMKVNIIEIMMALKRMHLDALESHLIPLRINANPSQEHSDIATDRSE